MRYPPFFYSLRFWEGVSWVLAGVAILLVYFGVLPDTYLYTAPMVLTGILAILKFLGVTPELRLLALEAELKARGLIE